MKLILNLIDSKTIEINLLKDDGTIAEIDNVKIEAGELTQEKVDSFMKVIFNETFDDIEIKNNSNVSDDEFSTRIASAIYDTFYSLKKNDVE